MSFCLLPLCDTEFSVQFAFESYSVLENVSAVNVCLIASRDCNDELTVYLNTMDGINSSYSAKGTYVHVYGYCGYV